MNKVLIGIMLSLFFTIGVQAQDSITPYTSRQLVLDTVRPQTGKILAYAKDVAYGDPNASANESVQSVLERLQASGVITNQNITFQYSQDASSWHVSKSPNDVYWRFKVGNGNYSDSQTLTSTQIHGNQNIVFQEGNGIILSTSTVGQNTITTVSVDANLAINWTQLRGIPDYATRWPTVDEVTNLDAYIQRYIQGHGLIDPHGPLWTKPARQVLRVGTAVSIDTSAWLDIADSYTANGLPNGLVINTVGVITGTPTEEGNAFATITATNADGTTSVNVPFIVLRKKVFDTAYLQRLEGLTHFEASSNDYIGAIDGDNGNIYAYNPKTGAFQDLRLQLETAGTQVSDFTGFVWTGSQFIALADPSQNVSGKTYKLFKFDSSGTQIGNNGVGLTRLLNAQGITYDGANLWTVNHINLNENYLYEFTLDFAQASGNVRLGPNYIPEGLTVAESTFAGASATKHFYIAETNQNQIAAYSASGNQQTYLGFTLDALNHEPHGITYYDGYFYVIEHGQGSTNDQIFVYPSKSTWDPNVADLTALQHANNGPFASGEAIRIRAEFSHAVDISADVTLRLDVGGNERQAISVSGPAGTTAVAQPNTHVAYFYYQVRPGDVDADGVVSYEFPFSTTGTIRPNASPLESHLLNTADSTFRVTQPGGVYGLQPAAAHRVNSHTQANLKETDPNQEDFVLGKNEVDLTLPRDTASLANFEWVEDDSLGIQYLDERTPPNQVLISTAAGWGDWSVSHTANLGNYVWIRIPEAEINNTGGMYIRSPMNDLRPFATVIADTSKWTDETRGTAHVGYFYYSSKQTVGTTGTFYTAKRQIRYDAIVNARTQVQSDWNETDTTSPAYIKDKPHLGDTLSASGENDFAGEAQTLDASSSEGNTTHVTPPSSLVSHATSYNLPYHVRLQLRWKARTVGQRIVITFLADGGALVGEKVFTSTDTAWRVDTFTLDVPNNTRTPWQIETDTNNNTDTLTGNTGIIDVDKLSWRISFPEAGEDLGIRDVTASAPITVTGTTTKNVAVSPNAIGPSYLQADTNAQKKAMRDRINARAGSGLAEGLDVASFNQLAGGAGTPYDTNVNISTDLQNTADGRPYEVSFTATVNGTTTGTDDVVVTVSIQNAAVSPTTVWDSEDVTSTDGNSASVYLSASLPAETTGFYIAYVRKTGTIGYTGSGSGVIEVGQHSQAAASTIPTRISWTPTIHYKSEDRVTANTFSNAFIVKSGNLVMFSVLYQPTFSRDGLGVDLEITLPSSVYPASAVPVGMGVGLTTGNFTTIVSSPITIARGKNDNTIWTLVYRYQKTINDRTAPQVLLTGSYFVD